MDTRQYTDKAEYEPMTNTVSIPLVLIEELFYTLKVYERYRYGDSLNRKEGAINDLVYMVHEVKECCGKVIENPIKQEDSK